MRELLPTAAVRRHITEVTPLPIAFDSALGQLPVPQNGTPRTIPLRQMLDALDMTTGVAFDEDYSNPDSDLWRYARATDALPKPADYSGVTGNLEFLTTQKDLWASTDRSYT